MERNMDQITHVIKSGKTYFIAGLGTRTAGPSSTPQRVVNGSGPAQFNEAYRRIAFSSVAREARPSAEATPLQKDKSTARGRR